MEPEQEERTQDPLGEQASMGACWEYLGALGLFTAQNEGNGHGEQTHWLRLFSVNSEKQESG